MSETCDSRGTHWKLRCHLPKGHVEDMTDWHEGRATTKTQQRASDWEMTIVQEETVRWEPNDLELPEDKRTIFKRPKAEKSGQ